MSDFNLSGRYSVELDPETLELALPEALTNQFSGAACVAVSVQEQALYLEPLASEDETPALAWSDENYTTASLDSVLGAWPALVKDAGLDEQSAVAVVAEGSTVTIKSGFDVETDFGIPYEPSLGVN